jgi:pimeloyl-ACP methyl ester carboxylesterase
VTTPATLAPPRRAPAPSFHRAWWRLPVYAALLVTLLSTFALATFQVRAYEAGVVRDSFTLNGAIPLPVLRYTPRTHPLHVVAVIAHGYAADKEIMSSFAVDLARQGITVYTYDLPGHGASTVPYGGARHTGVVRQLVRSVGEMVDYALAHAPSRDTRLVLIGYSLGTIAVGQYALEHPQLANLQATVLVAGILQARPTTTNPRNLLVLSGQFDLPGINDLSRRLIASGCNVPLARVADTYSCGPAPADARERQVLPGLDHISIITAASTHAVVLRWLGATVDPAIGRVPVNTDVRLHWLLLGFLAAALATLPLIALAAAGLRLTDERGASALEQDTPGVGTFPTWRGLAAFTGALVAALVVLRLWLPSDFWAPEPPPFSLLRQQVSADVALYFLLAGAFLLAALRWLPWVRPHVVWPARSGALRQLALAGLVALFLYLTLGQLSTFAWESLALSPFRLWRAAAYALLLFPFFLGVRALLTGYTRARPRRGALADIAVTLLVLLSLGAAIAMNPGRLSYLGILLPVVAVLLLALTGITAWSRRVVARPVLFLAAMQALLLGWILAATLPLIS